MSSVDSSRIERIGGWNLQHKENMPVANATNVATSVEVIPRIRRLSSSPHISKRKLFISGSNDSADNNNNNDTITSAAVDIDEIDPSTTSFYDELYIILRLALPNIISQLGWGVPSFLVASYIGRTYGSVYLDGYQIAILTVSLCTLSLLESVYGALDTVLPHSFGAKNYPEMQTNIIRGFVLCCIILIPFSTLLWLYMDPLLQYFGIDAEVAEQASIWYRWYSLSLPFYVIYYLGADFLSAQNIVMPEMIVALIGSIIVFPALLFAICPLLGYQGTAVVMVLYQAFQAFALTFYMSMKRPHHPHSWPTITLSSWKKVWDWKPFSLIVSLTLAGMLGSSEWIYWEVLSLMIGSMGIKQLSIHTIPTQMLTVLFMIPMGIGIGISIRVGNVIPQLAHKAKQICLWSVILSSIGFGLISVCIYIYRYQVYSIFTNDPEVIAGCDEIWGLVCFFLFNICLFEVLAGIFGALGDQWRFGAATVVYLWIIGIPAIYYHAIYKDGGLNAAWACIMPPYFALNVTLLLISFVCTDWEAVSADIREREGMDDDDNDDDDDDDDETETWVTGTGSSNDEEKAPLTKSTNGNNGNYGAASIVQ